MNDYSSYIPWVVFLGALLLLLFVASCRSVKEAKVLSKCEFRTAGIEKPELAGISIEGVQDLSGLGFRALSALGDAFTKGTLPLRMIVNIEIKNNNAQKAALNKLDWVAFIEEVEVAQGQVESRIEIAPNSTALMPVLVETDLVKFFKQEGSAALFLKALGLFDKREGKQKVRLKIKPTMRVGKKFIKYPTYINIRQEFDWAEL